MKMTPLILALPIAALTLTACAATPKPSREESQSYFRSSNPKAEQFPQWGSLGEDTAIISKRHHVANRHVLGSHPKKHGAELIKRHKTQPWLPTASQTKGILTALFSRGKK